MAQSWIDPSIISQSGEAEAATPSWIDPALTAKSWIDPSIGGDPSLHPALEAFVGLAQTPQTEAWSQVAAQKVQTWLGVRALADSATQAADEYIGNIDRFKSGLVQFVHNDPTGMPLALDLVPGTVNAFLPAENAEHAEGLIRHTQSEIVRSGVQSLAFHDEAAAHGAMDLYGEHLTDEDKSHLAGFIGTMAAARAADHAAQVIEEARNARLASDTLAHGYLARLTDPGTGDVFFPNNWMRDMIADPRVDPPTKAVLSLAHDRLVAQGDALYSDPQTVTALLDRALVPGALTPAEVWRHAGADLSLADTQMIAGAAFPKTPEQLREVQGVAATLASARDILASPENGAAGQAAFGRFVNWLLPEYRRAGPGSLDPNSETWLLGDASGSGNSAIMRFMPLSGDILLGSTPRLGTADRPSLGAIFGRISSEKLFDTTDMMRSRTTAPDGTVDLDRLETDESLGWQARQAVDRDALINAINRKYQLGPTAAEDAGSYADELRTFSNPTRGPNQ